MPDRDTTPLVSIIMPAYNAERYLDESINSVLKQTYSHWELIIIDDGSADNTSEIAQRAAAKDQRIRYFYQANGRQGKARNRGLREARGIYIAFLDADDLWVSDKLSVQVSIMQSEPVDLVYSDYSRFQDNSENASRLNLKPGLFQGINDFDYFLVTNRIGILTVMVKKSAVDAVHGFTEEPGIQNAEDLHLWQKLFLAGLKFKALEQPLAFYRVVNDSSSSADRHVILHALCGLKDIEKVYPQYGPELTSAFGKRLTNYLSSTNVKKNEMVVRLLAIRKQVCKGGLSSTFLGAIHRLFGMRVFRIIFLINIRLFSYRIIKSSLADVRL